MCDFWLKLAQGFLRIYFTLHNKNNIIDNNRKCREGHWGLWLRWANQPKIYRMTQVISIMWLFRWQLMILVLKPCILVYYTVWISINLVVNVDDSSATSIGKEMYYCLLVITIFLLNFRVYITTHKWSILGFASRSVTFWQSREF